jgi:hypothetical protein
MEDHMINTKELKNKNKNKIWLIKLAKKQRRKYLKSDRSQGCTHASVESSRPFCGHNIAKDAKGRTRIRVLLPDTERVEGITGDYTGNASKPSGDKFSTPAACNKLWPEIH